MSDDAELEKSDNEVSVGSFKKAPKNPRASARGRLRRRIALLQFVLHEVEAAIDDVFEAPGKTYKKDELEGIKQAIKNFREATGLSGDGLPEIEPLPDGFFERVFSEQPGLSQYEANTSPLATSLGLVERDGD